MDLRTPSLADVQVGDRLLLTTHRGPDLIATVDRVTAKYVTVGPTRFRKDNGHRVGSDSWDSAIAYPATEEDVVRVATERRQRKAFNALWNLFETGRARDRLRKLPAEQLEAAHALLAGDAAD